MSIKKRIITDQSSIVGNLNNEENQMALECAIKVKTHLEKAFLREQNPRFLENIDLVNQIISNHRSFLGFN